MNRRQRMLTRLAAAALLAWARPAPAQLALPQVQLPELPLNPVQELERNVDGVLRATDPRQLRELRRLRIRDLLRRNRAVLEADPRGAPILRSEVVALSPAPQALERAQAAGFTVGRSRVLEGLGVTIVVLQAPRGLSTRRALQRLRQADPQGVYDYNHVYMESGQDEPGQRRAAAQAADAGEIQAPPLEAGGRIKVGLIDGGVQAAHPVFASSTVHEHGCASGGIPSAHGTAVASLLVGRVGEFHGVVSRAELYAADVYCGLPSGGAVDAVAQAFAWLSREAVPVINVSLVGPPNALLEQVVRIVVARGHVVVAAVGNDGPGAPPLYPAAYPGVVAVTGVDAKARVLIEACRGEHVDFAAPGADMSAATLDAQLARVRGTSYAAPIVAGLLAQRMPRVDLRQAESAVAALGAAAVDLGARGRDKVYGSGLIGAALRPPESLAGKIAMGTE